MAFKRISPQPVVEGGTGIQSATAYAPICGGTTSTGAFQVASTGQSNSGYILTSTGSSSLPTWQAGETSTSGTFTPVLAFGGSSTGITYSQQTGNYMQLGNIVFFDLFVLISSIGSATGTMTLSGPPITNNFNAALYYANSNSNVTYNGTGGSYLLAQPAGSMSSNPALFTVYYGGSGTAITALTNSNIANGSGIQIQGFYFTV